MKPVLVHSIDEMKEIRKNLQGSVGFVPTMGYLHQGHLSLVENAQKDDIVIVSIYVNPTQFGQNEDLDKYPQDLDRDLKLLSNYKVDYVFFPKTNEMYPEGYKTWVTVDGITNILCGKSRPTHFRGVTTIVSKLINIVKPDFMYMGEKDFQQIAVLETMIKDLNFDTKIVRCPIIRESDGLAMSSRNVYLSDIERKIALSLSESIKLAKKLVSDGVNDVDFIKSQMADFIESKGGKIDYIEFISSIDLSFVEEVTKDTRVALAVFVGKTRLIDNSLLI